VAEAIGECTQVVGCVAWLRSKPILRALERVPCSIAITNDVKLPDYSALTPHLAGGPAVRKVGTARGRFRQLMHHKFIVGFRDNKPSFVITGSFNFTGSQNLENIVRIEDRRCAEMYLQEARQVLSIGRPVSTTRRAAARTKRKRG